MFEFSQMRPFDESIGAVFVAELDSFLAALPAGWQYGVEVRNEGLLGTDYFSALRRHRVAHVFNSWETHAAGGRAIGRSGKPDG